LVLLQLSRQPGGMGGIVSLKAVLDRNLHLELLARKSTRAMLVGLEGESQGHIRLVNQG
jgi:hypothetical protein